MRRDLTQPNTPPPPPIDEQATDDFRARAFAEVSSNLRSGVTVIWDAFKTYFTITSILYATFAFLQSNAAIDRRLGAAASLTLGIIGVLFTLASAFSIKRILLYQKTFLEYGKRIEAPLKLSLIATSAGVFDNRKFFGNENITLFVLCLFSLPWFAMIIYFATLPGFELQRSTPAPIKYECVSCPCSRP